jgi:hypothetical protein
MSPTRANIVLALLIAAVDSRAANLISNPSFETADFTDWSLTGNAPSYGVAMDATVIAAASALFQPNFVNVRSANYAGFAAICCSFGTPEYFRLSQTIDVRPNTLMRVGFSLGNDSASTFGVNSFPTEPFGRLGIYIDGVRLTNVSPGEDHISGYVSILSGSTPADFTNFFAGFDTGHRTSVSVMFAIAGSGSGYVGASFDDFFVEAVPEPSSYVLLLSGIASIIYIRRHSFYPALRHICVHQDRYARRWTARTDGASDRATRGGHTWHGQARAACRSFNRPPCCVKTVFIDLFLSSLRR